MEHRQRRRQPTCTPEYTLMAPIFGDVRLSECGRLARRRTHGHLDRWQASAADRRTSLRGRVVVALVRLAARQPAEAVGASRHQSLVNGRCSTLPPGQALRLPAGCRRRDGRAASTRALEPVGDVVGVRKPGLLRRLRRGEAALAAAADEVDVVLRR